MSIIIEDQSEDLTLFHYKGVSETNQDATKQPRGRILNDQQDVVCNTFGYTPEYTVEQREKYVPLLKDLSSCYMYKSEEGTLLRLFFYQHRWHLSTFKRINAFESRWSSKKTFGELFSDAIDYFFTEGEGKGKLSYEKDDVFDVFCNTLDRDLVYTFLLRTNEDTRIVCRSPVHPTVYFGGSFKNDIRSMENTTMLHSPERLTFSSVEDLEKYVQTIDPLDHQGVIIMLPDQSTVKIIHPQHQVYKTIRGSEPDVEMAYFRVRSSTEQVALFGKLFPNLNTNRIELQVEEMVKYLHRMYVRRFIKKLYTILHPSLFHVLRLSHNWHSENRKTNIVTLEKIKAIVKEQSSQTLFRMVHEFTEQSKRKLLPPGIQQLNDGMEAMQVV